MPNGPNNVNLTVDSSYGYQYSGGTEGNGDVHSIAGQGQAPVLITLHAPTGFNIVSVDFRDLIGHIADTLSYRVTGNGGSARIDNPCTAKGEAKYTVNVVDSSNGRTVACDPKIVNT